MLIVLKDSLGKGESIVWYKRKTRYTAHRLHVAIEARKIVVSGEAAGLQIQLVPPAVPGRFNSCDLPPLIVRTLPPLSFKLYIFIQLPPCTSRVSMRQSPEIQKSMSSVVYKLFIRMLLTDIQIKLTTGIA